jgi:hypothetical protein
MMAKTMLVAKIDKLFQGVVDTVFAGIDGWMAGDLHYNLANSKPCWGKKASTR